MYDDDIDDDNAPDIITIKHRGASYALPFLPFIIGDGVLTVGDVRDAAAMRLGVSPPSRVKLLYKGKLLKADNVPAKAVGLKQNSQVMCVVRENFAQEGGSSSELSLDEQAGRPRRRRSTRGGGGGGDSAPGYGAEFLAEPPRHRRHRSPSVARDHGHSPVHDDRPSSSSRPPAAPSPGPHPTAEQRRSPAQLPPSPSLNMAPTPLGKIELLEGYLEAVIRPLCRDYIEDPPRDQKKREFEHRRIGETAMQQVILKADGIDIGGDDFVRQRRKALLGEIEALLGAVDEVAKL